MKITVDKATPTVGETFVITAPKDSENDIYTWSGPALYNYSPSNSPVLTVSNCKYSNRGWYYCSKGNNACKTLIDSVFVDIKLKQETPACNLTNNYVSCSNVPSVTLTSVTMRLDPSYNGMAMVGSGANGYPGFTVLFNSYNGNFEPVDGVYITSDRQAFNLTQEYNAVSVSFQYSYFYFHCRPDQKLYVSHVNGKIQVSFCAMIFSDGTYTSTCSWKMTKL